MAGVKKSVVLYLFPFPNISRYDGIIPWNGGIIPGIGGFIPRNEAFIPGIGEIIPRIEAFIPGIGEIIPRIEASIPGNEAVIMRIFRYAFTFQDQISGFVSLRLRINRIAQLIRFHHRCTATFLRRLYPVVA